MSIFVSKTDSTYVTSPIIIHALLCMMIAIVGYPRGKLVEFDPRTGKKLREIIKDKSLAHIAFNGEGELWVADNTPRASGIRVFDAKTGKELTTAPIAASATDPPVYIQFAIVDSSAAQ